MRTPRSFLALLPLLGLGLVHCAHAPESAASADTGSQAGAAPTAEEAAAFVEEVNAELKRLMTRGATAEWVKSTYITHDTENLSAWMGEEMMAYLSEAIAASTRFQDVENLDPDTRRMIDLLRLEGTLPAPNDREKRAELAQLVARLEGMYGRGKYCPEGADECLDLGDLEDIIGESRDYDVLLDAWTGWRTVSPPMKEMYAREVALANEGAREIGFENVAELWKAGYEMSGAEFEQEADRLWNQVKPLYEQLHCYVRARLADHYGEDKVPLDGPIPAHLLGNMWAQEWSNIYDLAEPYPGESDLDVTGALRSQGWDAERMVKTGENFFTSLGLEHLPDTFWTRSMFTKPADRDVVCHASAWDVTSAGDIRIKMCIEPDEENLITIHHELGHNYYYVYYKNLPILYQSGANDGFHEAIGDALVLSMTPGYYRQLGLVDELPEGDHGLVNTQMKRALDKIAFLPFGRMIDQWRWDVFAGNTPPSAYNGSWWQLREAYQGVAAPVERTEEDFDPGAKFHIPGNTPYIRYFLAHILQFQFHEGLCRAAGHEGPLHECSIYGSEEAGDRLRELLSLGASRPWPEALEVVTGSRQMDGGALLRYFQPLHDWLEQENADRSCGW